jgi:hypothetical protein
MLSGCAGVLEKQDQFAAARPSLVVRKIRFRFTVFANKTTRRSTGGYLQLALGKCEHIYRHNLQITNHLNKTSPGGVFYYLEKI